VADGRARLRCARAGTIANAARVLHAEGAREVYACATHAVFSPPAVERLSSGLFQEVRRPRHGLNHGVRHELSPVHGRQSLLSCSMAAFTKSVVQESWVYSCAVSLHGRQGPFELQLWPSMAAALRPGRSRSKLLGCSLP
jgi:hypothetical protein